MLPETPTPDLPSAPEPIPLLQPTPVDDQPMPTKEPGMLPAIPAGTNRGNIYLDEISLILRESSPVQVAIYVSGSLPTPCHDFHADIQPPDEENRIFVELYSTSDPNVICIQVLEPLDTTIELGTFPAGKYSVWVNSEKIGEFDT